MSKETSASDFGVGEDWRSQRHSSCPVRARPASGQSCSPSAWAQGPGALDSAGRLKERGKGDDESLANVAFGPQGRLLSWVTALKGAWGWQGWSPGQSSSPGLRPRQHWFGDTWPLGRPGTSGPQFPLCSELLWMTPTVWVQGAQHSASQPRSAS